MKLTLSAMAACILVPFLSGVMDSSQSCELGHVGRAVYSDVTQAEESGDLSGLELELIRDQLGIWRGVVTFAEGEMGMPLRVASLELDLARGNLSFAIVSSPSDTVYFSGTITCEKVEGEADVYRGVQPQRWSLRRVNLCNGASEGS